MTQPASDPDLPSSPTSAELTDPTPASASDAPLAGDAPLAPEVPMRPRRSLARAVIAAVVLVTVAGVAFGAGYFVGRPGRDDYKITVYLAAEATEADRAAVRSALERLDPS